MLKAIDIEFSVTDFSVTAEQLREGGAVLAEFTIVNSAKEEGRIFVNLQDIQQVNDYLFRFRNRYRVGWCDGTDPALIKKLGDNPYVVGQMGIINIRINSGYIRLGSTDPIINL